MRRRSGGRYLVEVRDWSGPWRTVTRVATEERARFWLLQLKAEHPRVRILCAARVIEQYHAPHEDA